MIITKQKLLLIKEEQFEYEQKICNTLELVGFVKNFLKINSEPQEVTYILILNNKNQLVSFTELARGGNDFCNFSMKDLFSNILLSNGNKFILVHNHPSGDPTPSKNDIKVTEDIFKSANMLGLQFLDHIVIGDNQYISIMKVLKGC